MLPEDVQHELIDKDIFDFGISVDGDGFRFYEKSCELPSSLVMAALAIATSGLADDIFLAGFDGYPQGDPRNDESEEIFRSYIQSPGSLKLTSITPTRYNLDTTSVFAYLR